MTTPTRRFTDEVLSDEMAAILRSKTPAERLAITFGIWQSAWQMIYHSSKQLHPEWSDEEVKRHTIRRMSHGTI